MRVCLTVSDCPPLEGELPRRATDADRSLPLMPALTRLARRADRHTASGSWRASAWREVFGDRPAPSPAVVAAWAVGSAPGTGVWLAQPVRLAAATDHLRLPGTGLLRMDESEARDWIAAFGAAFGADLPQLRAVAGGFVLEGIDASPGPPDPAECLGMRVDPQSRGGPAGLRRHAAELELWLHEHPLNLRRQRRGLPAISALWVWGGGTATEPPAQRAAITTQLFGDDAYVAGLAAATGVPLRVANLADVLDDATAAPRLVQVPAAAGGATDELPLDRIDRAWIAPLVDALERGRVDELVVAIGPLRFETRRSHRLRWWRRARPWWDTAPR